MRHTCQLVRGGEPCGKPAVDFVVRVNVDDEDYKFWLCAEHFDQLQRIRQILDRERD